MIHALRLQNFKCFENQSIQFRPLTLLSGFNSTGKSSVLQALLLLRQSYQKGLLPNTGIALNGDLTRIGTGKDALFERAKQDKIGFELVLEDGNEAIWRFNYQEEMEVLEINSPPINPDIYQSSLFSDRFHYLQAERSWLSPSLEMSDFQVRQHRQLGSQGEYTAHFISYFGNKDIPNSKLAHSDANSLLLKNQIEAWIREVIPGTNLHLNPNLDTGTVSLQDSFGTSQKYRAINFGLGISYTLPILAATLSSIPGTLLLIENPEAYLHPKGQAKMGQLLAIAASCGVQVVIETHSDHVLNGIRLAVHGGKLDHKDVQLHYFQRQEKEGQLVTEVISPRIDRNGRIDYWPDGFFDEWENSLIVLLKPRGV